MSATKADTRAIAAKLAAISPKARAIVDDAIVSGTAKLWSAVRLRLAGTLSDGIRQDAAISADGAAGRVYSDFSVPYARIREYGGRIDIPELVPHGAKVLAFPYEGRLVFAARVKAHSETIPARPYMRPALADFAPPFLAELRATLAEATA